MMEKKFKDIIVGCYRYGMSVAAATSLLMGEGIDMKYMEVRKIVTKEYQRLNK